MKKFVLLLAMASAVSGAMAQTAVENPVETPQTVPGAIEGKGMLKAIREVKLASRSQGVISEIKEEGTQVKGGDTVVLLEDKAEKIAIAQQEQVLKMRQAEGDAGESLRAGGNISKLDGMEKEINLEVAKLMLEEAKERLDRRRVVAPFPGVITERMREVGEAVDEFVPVMTMVDLSKLYFEVYLPASNVRDVSVGQTAEVVIDTFPEKKFPGTVQLISPVVNAASSEFKVRIVIDNSDRILSAGLSGSCRIFPPTSASVTPATSKP